LTLENKSSTFKAIFKPDDSGCWLFIKLDSPFYLEDWIKSAR